MMAKELAALQSLLGKSEKVITKLRQGTWQYTMLEANINALRITIQLAGNESADFTPDELDAARASIADLMDRTKKSQSKFSVGTSQHMLQTNRLSALQLAFALIERRKGELEISFACAASMDSSALSLPAFDQSRHRDSESALPKKSVKISQKKI